MKKKLLALLLAALMMVSVLPVSAFAFSWGDYAAYRSSLLQSGKDFLQSLFYGQYELKQEEPAAEAPAEEVLPVEETEEPEKPVLTAPSLLTGPLGVPTPASWTALQNALSAETPVSGSGFTVNGNTITLTANFTAEEGNTTLLVSGEKTLDLNGHVIDGKIGDSGSVGSVITVPDTATLTVIDNTTTSHKFSTDTDGKWVLNEDGGNYTVTGGVITGGKGDSEDGGGVKVIGTCTMNGGNIVGNTATNGGGVNIAGTFAMYGGNISGNTAAYGGGVYVDQFIENPTFVMEGGIITDNTASADGGGVYVSQAEKCLAAGTPITLADGTRTAIENLKKGDMVRVFDHETGKISSAKLFDLWKYPAKQSGAFTLHFTNGIDVTAVGGHCFFDRAENQYAAIDTENVNDYIGHQFYNADDGRWETLTGVTFLTEAVDTYIIVSEKHLNVVADGMLSNEDGIYALISNMFAFGENLTIDAAAKEADIAQYGLWGYENMQYFSRYAYDALNLQYMSVLFGRGIFTPEEFAELEAYSAEIDPELYCSGKEAENGPPQKAEEKESLLTKIVSFLTAPFVKVAYAADLSKLEDTGVYFGGEARIVGNRADNADNKENNVYLCSGEKITLGTGTGNNGVATPTEGFKVGVTLADGDGTFTGAASARDINYFKSDNDAYMVQYNDGGYLELVKTFTVTVPTELTHKVYVGSVAPGNEVQKESGDIVGGAEYKVASGSNVFVVFTAAQGYQFTEDSTTEYTVTYENISENKTVIPPEAEKTEPTPDYPACLLTRLFDRAVKTVAAIQAVKAAAAVAVVTAPVTVPVAATVVMGIKTAIAVKLARSILFRPF